MVPRIHVDTYCGYRADERPLRFRLEEEAHVVADLIECWRSPDGEYFKVSTLRGRQYVLKHCYHTGEWSIQGEWNAWS